MSDSSISEPDVNEQSLARYQEDPDVYTDPVWTEEDRDVWMSLLTLLQQIWKRYENSLHPDYLSGLRCLDISTSRIPSLSEINGMLASIGWSAAYVDGMVNDRLYQEMQASKVFPVARHIRQKRDLYHSAAPDFIHDVIGHLPMLFSPQYQSLLNDWALRALTAPPDANDVQVSRALAALIEEREKKSPDLEVIAERTAFLQQLHLETSASPSRAARFARFYAWAIEFGVTLDKAGSIKINGSAALSSPGEFERMISGKVRLQPFVSCAITSPVNYSVVQDTMFVARDFSEYQEVLANI
jgi:phenylalanine-4-hydroxylase